MICLHVLFLHSKRYENDASTISRPRMPHNTTPLLLHSFHHLTLTALPEASSGLYTSEVTARRVPLFRPLQPFAALGLLREDGLASFIFHLIECTERPVCSLQECGGGGGGGAAYEVGI